MKSVETFKCLECNHKWGRNFASYDKPICPVCEENLDVEETTDEK